MNRAASRWIVSSHFAALVIQLTSAVAFAAGWPGLVVAHGTNAWIVAAAGATQAIWLAAPGVAWASTSTRAIAAAVVLCEIAQLYFGLTRGIALHVGVAMLIWAGGLALMIRAWAPLEVAQRVDGN